MCRFARRASSKSVRILPTVRPFSNFRFLDEKDLGATPIRRLFSQARQHDYTALVEEEIELSEDLRQENEDLRKACGDPVKSAVLRFSFFTGDAGKRDPIGDSDDDQFLGYAIVKTDCVPGRTPVSRVYESVLRPGRDDNTCVRRPPEWQCRVAGRTFRVAGQL